MIYENSGQIAAPEFFTTMTHHRFIIIITIKHQQAKEKKN